MARYLRSEHGASAAEFALVLPVMLLLLFGLLETGMLMFTSTQLHWAVEDAARCAAIRSDCKTSGTTNAGKVTNWAKSSYKGLSGATFAYANNGPCSRTGASNAATGNKVTGTANFKMNVGVFYKVVAINASACAP